MSRTNNHSRNFTFFVWADTHFGYDQKFDRQDLRHMIIDQMNNLAGMPYPQCMGGTVDPPEFIIHCGDVLDGVKPEPVELAYYDYFMSRLHTPSYEVLGNHDGSQVFVKKFLAKYGARSYSFQKHGVHFISLNLSYAPNEVGHVDGSDLAFLQNDLDSIPNDTPVILCVHSRLDRLTNGSDVLNILKGRRIMAIISAHIHKPSIFELNGFKCIDVGQCRNHPIDPESGRSFYVMKISGNSIAAVPWRWDLNDWERGQRWEHAAEKRMKSLILSYRF